MHTDKRSHRQFPRSSCPVANMLDLVGDKWSLLIVRDLMRGKRTYGELADSPEGIPTNILADRLKRLEEGGIIVRSAYQDRPVRFAYLLSEKGGDLADVLMAMVRWGKRYIPGTRTLDESKPSARSGKGDRAARSGRKVRRRSS